jgi:hypothetical protein
MTADSATTATRPDPSEKSYAIWRCPTCRRPLGVTDGRFLLVGGLTLSPGVAIGCPCGDVKHFRREPPPRPATPA